MQTLEVHWAAHVSFGDLLFDLEVGSMNSNIVREKQTDQCVMQALCTCRIA